MDSGNMNSEIEQAAQECRKVTLIGMLLNIGLTFGKILIGYFGNSGSVIADGVHSLSDVSTDVAVLVGVKYWNKPPDIDHPYGHRRIEAMISVLIGVVLGLAGLFLGWGAIEKIHHSDYVVPAQVTLIIAIISIITKEWLYRWTARSARKLKSAAMLANAWHHRSDSFSSIPVAIAISLAMFDPKWAFMDPVATLAVSGFIIQAAYVICLPSLKELADSGADEKVLLAIEKIVLQVEGVLSVHAVRSRFHGSGLYVDLHIQVNGKLTVDEGHKIAGCAKRRLIEEGPDIVDVLVHIEPAKKL